MSTATTTRIHSSIQHVPQALWDEKLAQGHPFKSAAFLSCLEDSFPERKFGYLVMSQGEDVVGLAVITEERLDLTLLMPDRVGALAKGVRRVMPGFLSLGLGMVGTFETAQRHWWYDARKLSEHDFAQALLEACDEVCTNSALLLVRDFMEGLPEDLRLQSWFLERGFKPVANHPMAMVTLDGMSSEEHFQRLKKKSRQNLRKKLKDAEALGFQVERVRDFRPLIDACYPLYLQVHEGASEFKRNPFPRAFFETIAERMPTTSSFLTLRTQEGQLIAFILTGTGGGVHNPFLIGMDYARTEGTPAYYLLLWKELEHAARHACRVADLGLTSYFVKQTVGAELEGMTMAARLQSPWLRPLINPLLPLLLSEKQPEERRRFRVSTPDDGQQPPSHKAA
ncbi:GNAT family N-acetyltransferase [Corallococcus exiguus]|uniref:GNAT family N-acetyltransferase n=1 Tax=Corallococcus exiguus TaxID=83462 RepID=A0A7X4YET5_9BACT|nr:GNAT family N-acetyltransferase [Corallococcus exiguus]NBC43042.1 GNAT family N-acetyltransferase [Corallococcus exiguus]TNV62070.1 GNAT family N-acetyltransferase [Corallococcus exiguus]